jgi:hypothetical protein
MNDELVVAFQSHFFYGWISRLSIRRLALANAALSVALTLCSTARNRDAAFCGIMTVCTTEWSVGWSSRNSWIRLTGQNNRAWVVYFIIACAFQGLLPGKWQEEFGLSLLCFALSVRICCVMDRILTPHTSVHKCMSEALVRGLIDGALFSAITLIIRSKAIVWLLFLLSYPHLEHRVKEYTPIRSWTWLGALCVEQTTVSTAISKDGDTHYYDFVLRGGARLTLRRADFHGLHNEERSDWQWSLGKD